MEDEFMYTTSQSPNMSLDSKTADTTHSIDPTRIRSNGLTAGRSVIDFTPKEHVFGMLKWFKDFAETGDMNANRDHVVRMLERALSWEDELVNKDSYPASATHVGKGARQ